MELTLTTNGVL